MPDEFFCGDGGITLPLWKRPAIVGFVALFAWNAVCHEPRL